jgi:hypothetical protein
LKEEEGEMHHFKRAIEMEAILNLCTIKKLHTTIVQEEHDVLLTRQHKKQTTRMVIGKRFY